MNNVLRPACLSDLPYSPSIFWERWGDTRGQWKDRYCAAQRLYDFEWQKRGYVRSP